MRKATAEKDSPFERNTGEATFTRLESGSQSAVQQRRAFPRYGVDLDVSLGSDHNFYAGFVENISAGGVFVATHVLKPVGEHLELTIHLPDREEPLHAVGEVRWVREYSEASDVPPGMGVRFVQLPAGAQAAIERFLEHREPLFFDDD